jgi:hypothetical protein
MSRAGVAGVLLVIQLAAHGAGGRRGLSSEGSWASFPSYPLDISNLDRPLRITTQRCRLSVSFNQSSLQCANSLRDEDGYGITHNTNARTLTPPPTASTRLIASNTRGHSRIPSLPPLPWPALRPPPSARQLAARLKKGIHSTTHLSAVEVVAFAMHHAWLQQQMHSLQEYANVSIVHSSLPSARSFSLPYAVEYKCQFCNRAFSRSEHRSRHERSRKCICPSRPVPAMELAMF